MTDPPLCSRRDCTQAAIAQWQRRATADEFASTLADARALRERALRDHDPALPEPRFGPLPTADDCLVSVFGCAEHAIDIDQATLIHEADCPGCTCTPAPPALGEAATGRPGETRVLPTGWTVPA